jgi:hypothetical protein
MIGKATRMNKRWLMRFHGLIRSFSTLLVGALLAIGCGGGPQRLEKSPGSTLWVASASEQLDTPTLERMSAAGLTELFVPLGELDVQAASIERRPLPELPPSMRITMVLGGSLDSGLDAEAGARTAAAIDQLRFDIEARGVIPVGIHLDPTSVGAFKKLAAFLQGLSGALDPELYLSISLHREALDQSEDEGLAAVLAEVDFVVPFLYGQLPRESDSGDAWDFDRLSERLEVLESYQVPYLVGIIGLGTASHIQGNNVRDRGTRHSLRAFLWNRDLKLSTGFTLAGAHRRVYEMETLKKTQAGGWDLAAGDVIRVVRTNTYYIKDLRNFLTEGQYPHRLGELYYRLVTPEERLSLNLDNILNVLEGVSVEPQLTLQAQVQRRTAKGWIFRFLVSNENGETTGLSTLDGNYLEITAEGGNFHANVDTGDFFRYDLLQTQSDGSVRKTFRNVDMVRLYSPMIEGQQQVTSGNIEVRMRAPVLRITGHFSLPDGTEMLIGPRLWRDGEFADEAAAEDDSAAASP